MSQISNLSGVKKHTLNARVNNKFEKQELERTNGNQIILNSEQVRNILSEELINDMGKIIYIGNLKGGVGKTTLSYLLSDTLSEIGLKVCCIDLDVQANLTNLFLNNDVERPVFYDLIDKNIKIEKLPIKVKENLDIIPSSLKNSLIEKALTIQAPKHHLSWFKKLCINYLRNTYDVIIVDTPPSLTTLNSVFSLSLIKTDNVIIPVNPEEFSIMGVQMFVEDIADIRKSYEIEDEPQISIIMNRFFQNQRNNLEVLVKMSKLFDGSLSEVIIRDIARLKEVINNKESIKDIKNGKDILDTIYGLLVETKIIKSAGE
ncbi:ParA family protein [Francisella sp. 19X1-34]|uniref:ParA family protein n=1 Tax=Francisella sp. 19X1-34 TaxID=3087177 RepID=UPI002E3750BD|nr:ParA family protein [Francisella sp. 19X1-34]MED7789622.1 ParA family protein [Francisella sp. 19X1-34]